MENDRTIEERVEHLERALNQVLHCLGMKLVIGPHGEIGYSIQRLGPESGWGVLAKIMNDITQLKNDKRIIIPGR